MPTHPNPALPDPFSIVFPVTAQDTYVLRSSYAPSGNSTYAGATAAIMANAVLIAYVFVAMTEDAEEQKGEKKKESRKDR